MGTENPGLAVSVGGDPTADPPAELSAVLVRVTQEALTNAVKHGSPDQIRITLDHRPTSVQLEVHDDGCGFDTTAPRTAASFGLDGMARRVDDLGGTLEVESEVGGGTSVRAVLPTGTTEKEL